VRVHLAAEHALELELAHRGLESARFAFDVARGGLVVLGLGELEELRGIRDRVRRAIEFPDVGGETGALLAEQLRALGIAPDRGVLELAVYFLEALDLAVVLKETPVANGRARRGP